ncbi:MAG TPA: hypothetical protein VN874_07670 [Myxococcales bacterium]|nr:hypothetical protein [Myxococcales bacterium]
MHEPVPDAPAQTEAWELRVHLAEGRQQKLAAARTAVGLHQDDPGSLLLVDAALADEAGTAEEEELRLSSLERAAAVAPDNSWALQRLARAYVRSSQGVRAAPLVRRSLQLRPDNPGALDTFALVAEAQGDCRAARDLQRMAVERLPPPPDPSKPAAKEAGGAAHNDARDQIAAMRARLARYEARCPG